MSASPSDPSTDTESQNPPNPTEDLQVLLIRLQASASTPVTPASDHDILVDKLMMMAVRIRNIDRDFRLKCLHLAYFLERPTSNVSERTVSIQTAWYAVKIQARVVLEKLVRPPKNQLNDELFQSIVLIFDEMEKYIRNNLPVQSHSTKTQRVYPQHVQRPPKTYTPYTPWVPNPDRRPAAVHQNPDGTYYMVSNKLASQASTSDLTAPVDQVRPCRCEGCPGCDGTPEHCRCIGRCRCADADV